MTDNLPLQEARLEVWRQERLADLSLRELFPLDSSDSPQQEIPHHSEDDKELHPGQVRLLPEHPEIPCSRAPVYVLLFERTGSGSYLAFPFSPYGQPATSGEYRTSLAPEDGPRNLEFRTICLWNALILPPEFLEKTWHMGFMPPRDLENIRILRKTGVGLGADNPHTGAKEKKLPLELQLRIGPQIAEMPARFLQEIHDYLAEEELWKDSLLDLIPPGLPASIPAAEKAVLSERGQICSVFHPSMNAWKELLQREASTPENCFSPGFYGKRFAVWMANVPKEKFLHNAYNPHEPTPLVLLESAVEALTPNEPIRRHQDPDTEFLIWRKNPEPGFDFDSAATMSFFRHSGMPRLTKALPANKTVLLFDGSTSEYLGEGATAADGVIVKLLPGKKKVQAPQLVLCAGE